MDELVLAVIYLIIFGGIGYYSYICIKAEGIFWVPKAILQSFMFICFFMGFGISVIGSAFLCIQVLL